MKKRICRLLLAFLLVLVFCVSMAAAEQTGAQLSCVTDTAGLLSENEKMLLERMAESVSQKYGVGVYIVTVEDYRDFHSEGVYKATYTIYHQYTMGEGPNRDGIMLLLSMADRDWAMFCYGSHCEYAFNSYGQEKLEKVFLDNFGEDDWYGGFSDFVSGCEWYLQHVAEGGEAGVPVHNEVEISDSTQENTADDSFTLGGAFGLSLLISCVAALIVCMVFRSQMKSVRTQTTANQYVGNGGLNLTLSRDIYRYTSQKRRQIPRNDNNNNPTGGGHGGAGFSGSVSHTSSSGHGRSGKF